MSVEVRETTEQTDMSLPEQLRHCEAKLGLYVSALDIACRRISTAYYPQNLDPRGIRDTVIQEAKDGRRG